jgi:cytochrome d ubiquinol oxidase subunit I
MITYWGFRLMILFGAITAFGALATLWWTRGDRELPRWRWLPGATLAIIATPFLGNIAGWIFTEMGRQPWVVAPNPTGNLQLRLLTADGISKVSAGTIATSLGAFALVYGALAVVELRLLSRYVKAGPAGAMGLGEAEHRPDDVERPPSSDGAGTTDETEGRSMAFAY